MKAAVADSAQTLESLEDAVLDLESETEARHELMKTEPALEEQLDETRRREEVESALSQLKAKLKKG
ncbi:MAG: hypothetical protein JXR37_32110 [Kiritimatiellae bacterium]|nr:hypothetical protein [Kiritimatiellia bacterium]